LLGLAYNTDIFNGWKREVSKYPMYKYEYVCMYVCMDVYMHVYDIWRL